ncbi:MAG TPA: fibronectin type III domain-containing protein [Candidatus Binatia bacterium]|nr:fibronectin type III domain-containing protein [Candidatus Binatia bacterium]
MRTSQTSGIRVPRRARGYLAAGASLLALFCTVFAVSGGQDRSAPTKPGNFRVTSKTPFSISLAWSPSSDNSGNFTYTLASSVGSITLPKTATSYTWTRGLYPAKTYQFAISARDGAGNTSGASGLVTTLPQDTIAPSVAPVVSITQASSTYISLAWTPSQDNGPYLFYTVLVNGAAYASAGTNTSFTLTSLQPATSYTFNVLAQDYPGNSAPLSAAVTGTTTEVNSNDTIPPTTPGNLTDNGMSFQDGETWLFWQKSTDNFDPQSVLRYDIYVNGVLDASMVDGTMTVVYGKPSGNGPNTYQVIAVDMSGNQSAPATLITTP